MRYDKTPEHYSPKEKEDWERGYDNGYADGLNRCEEKYQDTDSEAYQSGYYVGYGTGYACE